MNNCLECRSSLEDLRIDAKFCSDNCRNDYHNRQKRIVRLKKRLAKIKAELEHLEQLNNLQPIEVRRGVR